MHSILYSRNRSNQVLAKASHPCNVSCARNTFSTCFVQSETKSVQKNGNDRGPHFCCRLLRCRDIEPRYRLRRVILFLHHVVAGCCCFRPVLSRKRMSTGRKQYLCSSGSHPTTHEMPQGQLCHEEGWCLSLRVHCSCYIVQ